MVKKRKKAAQPAWPSRRRTIRRSVEGAESWQFAYSYRGRWQDQTVNKSLSECVSAACAFRSAQALSMAQFSGADRQRNPAPERRKPARSALTLVVISRPTQDDGLIRALIGRWEQLPNGEPGQDVLDGSGGCRGRAG